MKQQLSRASIENGLCNLDSATFSLGDLAVIGTRMRSIYGAVRDGAKPAAPKAFDFHMVGGQPLGWFFVGCDYFDKKGGCGPCDGYGKKEGIDLGRAIDEALGMFGGYVSSLKERGARNFTINVGSATTFNDQYFPPEQRKKLFEGVNSLLLPFVEGYGKITYVLETRFPQFKLAEMKELRAYIDPRIDIEVGMGVEASSDFVREVLLNKSYGKDILPRLQSLTDTARRYNIGIEGHSLLGIPGLSEIEAIASAVQTTKDLLDNGVVKTILMTTNIKEGVSFGTRLAQSGYFTVPSIHATVETMRALHEQGYTNFLPFGFAASDPTLQFAHGCGDCDGRVKGHLDQYAKISLRDGSTRAAAYFRDADVDCDSCKPAWIDERERESRERDSFAQRLPSFLERAERAVGLYTDDGLRVIR